LLLPVFEKLLSASKSGFFVSDSLTYGDILAYDMFDVLHQLKPICLRFYPHIQNFMKKFQELDGIKQRLATRRASDLVGKYSETTEYKVNLPSTENKSGALPAYVFEANSDVALVVLQEWWGVNDQIKSRAKEFQSKNITAVIPDLYRGKVATSNEEANHLMSGLDWKGAVQDVRTTVQFLKTYGFKKVFVVGYCMGGALSLASAVHVGKELSGAIAYYGIPSKELADPSQAAAPLQLHFGTKDTHTGFSDAKAQDALEATLKQHNVPHEFFRYDGLGHAFTNITNKTNYNADAAGLALDRTVKFIESHSK